jgi:hypothetical protein
MGRRSDEMRQALDDIHAQTRGELSPAPHRPEQPTRPANRPAKKTEGWVAPFEVKLGLLHVMAAADLTGGDLRAAIILVSRADGATGKTTAIGYRQLARDMGASDTRGAIRAVRSLEQKEWLRVDAPARADGARKGGRTANAYEMAWERSQSLTEIKTRQAAIWGDTHVTPGATECVVSSDTHVTPAMTKSASRIKKNKQAIKQAGEQSIGAGAPAESLPEDQDMIRVKCKGQAFRGWGRPEIAAEAEIDLERFAAFMQGGSLTSDDEARLRAAWPKIRTTLPYRGRAVVAS